MKRSVLAGGAAWACLALAGPLAAQESTYRLVEGWAELPAGVEAWGQTIGVEIDEAGDLWVFHRCFENHCVGRDSVPAVLRYDPRGRLVGGFGRGGFVWPHGFHLDAEGNLWTTDARGREGVGHQVVKWSRDGTRLLTLGTAGEAGADESHFDGPADVAVGPDGSIFVADGHGNDRVVKFSASGEYLLEWGVEGSGPGEFDEPHALAFDSRGRLFVGDRGNERIQVFDASGAYLTEWRGIIASGLYITAADVLYVADYQLRKGVVIADARDFREIGFVDGALGEGVTADRDGNVYVGEVIPRNLKKFERRPAGSGGLR